VESGEIVAGDVDGLCDGVTAGSGPEGRQGVEDRLVIVPMLTLTPHCAVPRHVV